MDWEDEKLRSERSKEVWESTLEPIESAETGISRVICISAEFPEPISKFVIDLDRFVELKSEGIIVESSYESDTE